MRKERLLNEGRHNLYTSSTINKGASRQCGEREHRAPTRQERHAYKTYVAKPDKTPWKYREGFKDNIKINLEKRINVLGKKTGAQNIVQEIKQYQEKWLQHVQRMDTNRLPKQALQYKPNGRRNIGRPRKRWRD